jgi:hypothetical protein
MDKIMPPVIALPDEALDDLKKIIELSDAAFNSLLKAINEAEPTFQLSILQMKVAETVQGVPKADIEAVLRAALNLYSMKSRIGLSPARSAEAVANSPTLSKSSDFSQDKRTALSLRLAKLLSCDKSLGMTSKAQEVMTQHERVFCHARILSDIRPVFANGPEAASAATIIHNLQIGFRHDGKHEVVYVALDTDDIKKLKDIIERAEKKTAALEAVLRASRLTYMKV